MLHFALENKASIPVHTLRRALRKVISSAVTRSFVWHYYTGRGQNLDIESIGALSIVRQQQSYTKWVQELSGSVRTQLAQLAARDCGNKPGRKIRLPQKAFQARRRFDFTANNHLFSIGNTTISATVRLNPFLNCPERIMSWEGLMYLYLQDRFVDVLDFEDQFGGDQEAGGVPYTFFARWTERFNGLVSIGP